MASTETGSSGTLPPAGWYQDPDDSDRRRWWDGQQWTEHRKAPAAEAPPPTTPQQAPQVAPTPGPTVVVVEDAKLRQFQKGVVIWLIFALVVAAIVVGYNRYQTQIREDAERYVDCIVQGGSDAECELERR
jgi:hypothetical protein